MLLAIDPGASSGVAWVEAGQPTSRLIDLRADSEGAMFTRARVRFGELILPGDIVGIEAMLMPRAVTISSRQVLFGFRAVIVGLVFERDARLIEVPPHTWRSHFLGLVHAPKQVPRKQRRAWLKARAQDRVRELGWGDVSEDQADALGLLSYLRASLDPTYVETMPLFGGR